MKRIKNTYRFWALGFLSAVLLFSSCSKGNDSLTVKENLAAFHTIEIDGVYDIVLIQDTLNSISVTGTEKQIDKSVYSVSDSVLSISTGHAGEYLHPKNENMQITIHISNLKRINIHETCSIVSHDPIGHANDEIGIVVDTKLAEIDLNLGCRTFYYWNNPNGTKMKLTGTVQELKLWNAGLGQVDASLLHSDYVLCENGSLGNCQVRASQKLEYSITNKGNIYYYGNPAELVAGPLTAAGKLIKAD